MPQSKSQPCIIVLSVSLYRWLLRLGPKKFLQAYEEIMLLDFRQHCRNAYAQGGICSVLRLWPFFISAIVDMSVEQFYESKRKIRLLLKGKQIKLNGRIKFKPVFRPVRLDGQFIGFILIVAFYIGMAAVSAINGTNILFDPISILFGFTG